MTCPFAAVVAPRNVPPPMVEETSTHVKALFVGSKTPTQRAVSGARMMSPLAAVVAPRNLLSMLRVEEMSTHVKSLASCRARAA